VTTSWPAAAPSKTLGWKPALPRPRKVSAALKAYAKLVMSADKGAVRDLSLLGD
jgi:dihydroxy-acid dehydratase